jgi:hypothetical protein
MKIDHEYLAFGLTVGIRNRVAIYNHMRSFLFDGIAGRGFEANDENLFNRLTIEQQAMRLTEEVVEEIEYQFTTIFDEMGSTVDENEIKTLVAAALNEEIEEKKSAFLVHESCGLDWLIHHAGGVAPMTPEGGIPMDGMMRTGPDA